MIENFLAYLKETERSLVQRIEAIQEKRFTLHHNGVDVTEEWLQRDLASLKEIRELHAQVLADRASTAPADSAS